MAEPAPQDSVNLYAYAPEHIPVIWHEVKPWLESALIINGHLTIEEVYHKLLTKEFQLWTPATDELEAAFITAIYDVRGESNCTIVACGGKNLDLWKHFIKDVEDWARELGCKSIRIYGRRGWARLFNYDIVSTEMRKEL